MKNFSLFTYLSLVLLIGACSKSEEELKLPEENPTIEEPKIEEPKNETYFTLNVSEDIFADSIEEWILIHDLEGNLIDYRMVQNGETEVFEALETETKSFYNITRLIRNQYPDGVTSVFSINTYTNIPKKSIWNYELDNRAKETNERIDGSFSLRVRNILPYYHSSIAALENYHPFLGYTPTKYLEEVEMTEVLLYERSDYIISIVDGNNNLKYTILENMQDGQFVDLDFSEFMDFDYYVNIEMPNEDIIYGFFIDGLAEDVHFGNYGFEYQSSFFSPETPPYRPVIKLGYLDVFAKFKTAFSITNNDKNYRYSYYKQGAPPDAIIIAEKPDFAKDVELMSNLNFTTSVDYEYYRMEWAASIETGNSEPDRLSWSVYSNKEKNILMTELPEEIKSSYPTLNLDSKEYQRTQIYLNDESYEGLINRLFISNLSRKDMEYKEEIITVY